MCNYTIKRKTEQEKLLSKRQCDAMEQTVRGVLAWCRSADCCTMEGSIRSFDRCKHSDYCTRAKEICQGVADMMRGTLEFETTIDLMATELDKTLHDKFSAVAAALADEGTIKRYEPVAPSGEDFARFAQLVPAMHFFVCSKPNGSVCYPHHHPKFDIDESTLPLSAALFSAFALSWQQDAQ